MSFSQCPPVITCNPSNATICADTAAFLSVTSPSAPSYQWYKNNVLIADSTRSTLRVRDAGSYKVTFAGCGSFSNSIYVTVIPSPTGSLTASPPGPYCAGDPITLTITTSSGNTYQWINPIPSPPNTNPQTVSFTGPTLAMAVIYDNTPEHCSRMLTLFLQVNDPINGGTISADQTICTGTTPAQLTGGPASGGSGSYTYQWQYTTTLGGSWANIGGATGQNYQPGVLAVTTYFRRIAYSPPCEFGTSNVVTITVNPAPSILGTATLDICSGGYATYSPTSSVVGTTYTWTGSVTSPGVTVNGVSASGSGNINDLLTLLPNGNSTGEATYVITPTGPAPTFCVGPTKNFVVSVYPIPVITNPVLSEIICTGTAMTPVTWTSTVTGTTYSWYATANPGVLIPQTSGTGNLPGQTLTNNTFLAQNVVFHVTPTGPVPANCPGQEILYTVQVQPAPTVTNTPLAQEVCSNQPTTLVTLTSNIAGTTFSWTATASPASLTGFQNAGTATIPVQTIINPTNSPGTVTYHIVPSGPGGSCNAVPKDYVITVNPIPDISSSLSGTACSNAPYTYTITSSVAGCTFSWSRASVPGIINPPGTGATASITETLVNTTTSPVNVTYVLIPTGPANTSCPGPSQNLVVAVKPQPTVDAGPDQTINNGTSTTLSGTASPGTGSITSIAWTPPAMISGPSNILNPSTVTLSSNQVYYLEVTDGGGCSSTDYMTVIVTGTGLAVNPTASPEPICLNELTHLHANATGGSQNYTYSWSSSPAGFSSTLANPDATPLVTTTYTVSVNDGFSTVSGNHTVIVNPLPQAFTMGGGGEYCAGGSGRSVTLSGSEANVHYQLYLGGVPLGLELPGTGSALDFGNQTSAGIYTVRAHVVATGCQQDMSGAATVIINPLPVANAGTDQTIAWGISTSLSGTASGGTGTLNYSWTPSGSIASGQGTLNPQTTNIYTNTEFTLTVTDFKACTGTDNVWVSLSGNPLSATVAASPQVMCNTGTPVSLTSAGAGGSGSYTYSWTSLPAGFTSTAQNPTASPTVTTRYFVHVSDGYNSVDTNVLVTVNPLPLAFDVTGGGAYCMGGSGLPVGLSSSETGVTYTLLRNGFPVTPTVAGTGGPISFGSQTGAFTYTVTATNDVTNCFNTMNGSVNITIWPLPSQFTVTGGGSYAFGGPGVPVGLSGSEIGVNYRLIRLPDTITPAPGLPGTGLPLDFGLQTQAGTYIVVGRYGTSSCSAEMSGSATVTINMTPTAFNLVGGGTICQGQAGLLVHLDGSEAGVRYVLQRNGDSITYQNGTGSPLDFGPYTTAGAYRVKGVNIANLATRMMNDTVFITVNPLPQSYMIIPQGDTCPNTAIYLNGSQAGIVYYLIRGNDTLAVVNGTGAAALLPFGLMADSGTYHITARNPVTGCEQIMIGTTVIHAAPEIFALYPPGVQCQGTEITLQGSQTGIMYQLRRDSLISVGAAVVGTGGILSFGAQTLPGVYRIVATNPLTHCYSWMDNSVHIYPNPAVYNIVPNTDTCSGALVRLNGSQTGMRYRLMLNASITLQTLDGTGSALVFGMYTTAGTYSIVAFDTLTLCESQMTGHLTIFNTPAAYNIIPNGIVCTGISVGLDNSEAGVNYTLYRDGWIQAAGPIPGTGGPVSFGLQTYAGVYTVQAVWVSTGCSRTMNGSATLSPRPTVYEVQPAGSRCAGTSITLNGSQTGIIYELMLNSVVKASFPGTGSVLDFGPQWLPGLYTIRGVVLATTCDTLMNGSVTIQPLPLVYNITPPGINCPPTQIGLDGSQTGISYQLYKNGIVCGLPKSGTGAALGWGIQPDGTYMIIATSVSTLCSDTMTGTVVISPGPTVAVGADTLICETGSAWVHGTGTNYSSLLWTTSGDGTFTAPTALSCTYNPGTLDKLSGLVQIYLSGTGVPPCPNATGRDTMILTIQHRPVAGAGPDDTICRTQTAQLAGTASNHGTVHWSSSGDGSFTNSGIPGPIYIPGPLDKAAGQVTLTFRAAGSGVCSSDTATDQMLLTIRPLPYAIAGNDTALCENQVLQCAGIYGNSTSVQWTTSGDGNFSSPASAVTVYTPGPADRSAGAVNLMFKAYGLGQCSGESATDTMLLLLQHSPLVNAGPDTLICENQVLALHGSAQHESSTLWTTSGDGAFGNPAALFTSYTPGPVDRSTGQVSLVLHAYGINSCSPVNVSDTLRLSLGPLPQVYAGADSIACPNCASPMHGVASGYSVLQWTSLSDGTFSNPGILRPTYTPGPLAIAQGYADLKLSAYGLTACAQEQVSSITRLSFYILPTASVSGTTVVCAGDTASAVFSLSGTAPFRVKYSVNGTVDSVSNILTNSYTLILTPQMNTVVTLLAVKDANCYGTFGTSTLNIAVNPLPQTYPLTATGGGTFCEGDSGVLIGLSSSQSGIFYQLMRDGLPVGYQFPGTGSAFAFPWWNTQTGVYKVNAVHPQTTCHKLFPDSVNLIMFLLPQVDFSFQTSCLGTPTQFQLSGIDIPKITLWNWNFGDGTTAQYTMPVPPSHTYYNTGSFNVVLSATDSNGCQRIVSHTVTVNPRPHALFASNAPVCQYDTARFTDHSYVGGTTYITQWHWEFGDGTDTLVTFPGNPDVTHVYSTSGLFQVRLTLTTDLQCVSDTVQQISVRPSPYPEFLSSNACAMMDVQFTDISQPNGGGAITQWSWNFGDPASGPNNLSNQQNPLHMYQSPGTYTVTMRIMSTNGCYAEKVHQVIVKTAPEARFLADSTCLGSPTLFTDQSIPNADSLIAWDWDFGDGWPHSSLKNPVHTYAAAGTYQVKLTVTNNYGCVHDTILPLVIIPKPVVDFASNAPQCVGSTVSYTSLAYTQTGSIVKWKWDFGDGTIIIINAPGSPDTSHIFQTTALQHTVRLTAYTADSCSDYMEYVLQSKPQPFADYTFSAANCVNEVVHFTDFSQTNGGGTIIAWDWDFDDPGSGAQNYSALKNPDHVFTVSGTHNVRLIVTNAGSCRDTVIKQVSVNPLPVANFSADSVCAGNLTSFTDQSLPNGGVITSWLWDFGDGTPSSVQQNPQHLYAQAGTYQVTLTVTNSNFCYKAVTKTVKVHHIPFAAFSYSQQNCAKAPVQFTDLSSVMQGSIAKWIWDFGDGSSLTVTAPNTVNPTHVYAAGGNYQVVLTVKTADSCSSSVMHMVNVNAAPLANFSFANLHCQGSPVQFSDLSQTNGGGTVVAWSWNFGDPSSSSNTSTYQNPTHSFDSAKVYSVRLIAVNTSGCQDTVIKPVTINARPSAHYTADTACKGQPTHFTDQSLANAGTLTSWLWNFGDGLTSSAQNPVHTYASSGIFQVSLTVTNSLGCMRDTVGSVEVLPEPVSAFTWNTSCSSTPTQFTDQSSPAGMISAWDWTFGDGGTSTQQNPVHIYTTPGTYTVTLTITDAGGCTSSLSKSLSVYFQPVAAYRYSSTFCPARQVTFTDSSYALNATLTSWYWDFGNGSYSTQPNPVHTFPQSNATYPVTLTVTDNHGCSDTMVRNVFVQPGMNFAIVNDTVCIGDSTHFQAVNLAAGDTLHDLRWNFGEPGSGAKNFSTKRNPAHKYQSPGIYLVYLRATNSDNCTDSVFREVTVNALPLMAFAYDTISHCDTTVQFINTSLGNGAAIDTMTWIFGDGDTLTFAGNIPDTLMHTYPGFGTYTVKVIGRNLNGCQSSYSGQVLVACVNARFSVIDTLYCSSKPVILADSSDPATLIKQWTWDFGDGSDSTYISKKNRISHTYEQPGVYHIRLYVKAMFSGIAIRDSVMDSVLVRQSSKAAFTVAGACLGDSSRFFSSSDSMGVSIISYAWKFAEPDTLLPDTSSLKDPVHKYSRKGKFRSRLIIRNSEGCPDTAYMNAVVHGLPSAAYDYSKACARYPIVFTDKSKKADTLLKTWTWSMENWMKPPDTLYGPVVSYVYNDSADYLVTLRVTDAYGCSDTSMKTVTVMTTPKSAFTITSNLGGTNGKIRLNNQSGNASSYRWSFGDGTTSADKDPEHLYNEDGDYIITLVAGNANKCYDTIRQKYGFRFDNLYVPNAFSPTSENLGVRFFRPVGMNLRTYSVKVFDKWGHLLWSSEAITDQGEPAEGWDGMFNGVLCAQDTYFWRISATFTDGREWQGSDNGVDKPSTMGTVTLIR
jgi:PKD repeat protein